MEKSKAVTMKLLIDPKKKQVLFAEAGKECVDILFYILSLPIASALRLLKGHEMDGSLSKLYRSFENLDINYIQPDLDKESFLESRVPVTGLSDLLGLNNTPDDDEEEEEFYLCSRCLSYVSDDSDAHCPSCRSKIDSKVTYVEEDEYEEEAGLVKGAVTYMVTDDLVVQPISTDAILILLKKFNVKDVGALEQKVVNFGMDKVVELLQSTLECSDNVLTEVFYDSI